MGRISMPQGRGSQLHNRREYAKIGRAIPDNIDVTKSNENVTLVDQDLREAYRDIFGDALGQYNSKQKRADRKIEDYYDHIGKSKNGEKIFYEDVVQWGKKKDFENNPELRQRAKKALMEYATTFQERNPNLRLVGVYLHMDEASPHLHIDYVPVAHGYTRGLATRNSLDKAMKEMGFKPESESRKNNATKLWKESERAFFGKICRNLGLEVEPERKSTRKSLSVDEYKDARDDMIGEIEQEYNEKKARIENLDEIASYIASDDHGAIKVENMTMPEKKSFWGKSDAPERVGVFVENMDKGQVEALMQRIKADDKIEDALERTHEQCRELILTAKKEAKGIRAEATADLNQIIANAQSIIRERDGILAKAKAWADNVRKKYKELSDMIDKLLNQKRSLESEISVLQTRAEQLEPLKTEVQELEYAKAVLTGELENEITQSRFHEPRGGYNSLESKLQWSKLDKGELLALYKDGSIRTVTRGPQGGFDYKTLEDMNSGLCRIGWFQKEEQITIPRNLLTELISVIDDSKPISKNLETMVEQQNTANRVVDKIRGKIEPER